MCECNYESCFPRKGKSPPNAFGLRMGYHIKSRRCDRRNVYVIQCWYDIYIWSFWSSETHRVFVDRSASKKKLDINIIVWGLPVSHCFGLPVANAVSCIVKVIMQTVHFWPFLYRKWFPSKYFLLVIRNRIEVSTRHKLNALFFSFLTNEGGKLWAINFAFPDLSFLSNDAHIFGFLCIPNAGNIHLVPMQMLLFEDTCLLAFGRDFASAVCSVLFWKVGNESLLHSPHSNFQHRIVLSLTSFLLVCVTSPDTVTAIWLACGGVMNCIHHFQLPRWGNSS